MRFIFTASLMLLSSLFFAAVAQTSVEKEDYNNAIRANTVEAYKRYLGYFENDPRAYKPYINDIKARLENAKKAEEDDKQWQKAKAADTEEAYRNYMATAPLKLHTAEAESAIKELAVKKEWAGISASTNISTLETFRKKYAGTEYKKYADLAADRIKSINYNNAVTYINAHPSDTVKMKQFLADYPNSANYNEVYEKLHLSQANNYYYAGNYGNALYHYNLAKAKTSLNSTAQSNMNEAQAEVDYRKVNPYSESALKQFADTHRGTRKGQQVSNRVARMMADHIYSYDSYREAYRYALDYDTRKYVDRKWGAAQRKENGGIINLAIGFEGGVDPGDDDSDDVNGWYANGVVGLRIGNYTDPVQFEVGVTPGVWSAFDETCFNLPAYASLKFSARSGLFYVKLTGGYNIIRDDYLQGQYFGRIGIGAASKHFEWDYLFVQYNDKDYWGDDHFSLGMRMAFYITR